MEGREGRREAGRWRWWWSGGCRVGDGLTRRLGVVTSCYVFMDRRLATKPCINECGGEVRRRHGE